MRIAVYQRVSSDDQRERETIKTQTDCNQRWLDSHPEHTVLSWFIDDGVSGSIPLTRRPGGKQVLEAALAGEVDAVLVTRADRLGRDAIDLMQVRALLQGMGVVLIGSMEPLADEFSYDMLAVTSKHEKKRFLLRSREGTERAAREGRYCGGIIPFGLKVPGR